MAGATDGAALTPSCLNQGAEKAQSDGMKKLALLAMLVAGVVGLSPAMAVFWTARDRSDRYTSFGVKTPEPME